MTTASRPFDGIRVRAAQIGLYETLILHRRLADADAAALTAALHCGPRLAAAMPSLVRSNAGGRHSATGMLDWGGPAAVALADTAVKMAKGARISTVAIRRRSNVWSRCGRTSRSTGTLNMSHAHSGVL